jgi:hypothetical protein
MTRKEREFAVNTILAAVAGLALCVLYAWLSAAAKQQ